MNKTFTAKFLVVSSLLGLLGGCASEPTDRTVGTVVSDAAITTKVKTVLLGDPSVNGTNVNVETFRGTVQLSGFVANQEAVWRARDIASRVDGVREVRNALIVK